MTAWRWGSGRKGPDCIPERPGEPDQRRGRFARDGVWFFICCTQGISSPSTANVQPRDGNVAEILEKRLRSLQTGCSDKLLT